MPTSYTTLLGLALPVTGELAGVWGDVVSNYITQYLDSAVAGTQTISGSQTAVTLSVTNGSSLVTAGSGATGSAQFQIINCTGNPAGLLTITAPASSRQYIIINATSTSQSVKIVGTGPTTGVTLIAGEKAHVAWNGSDFVKIATTAAAGGSNTQVQYNSSGVLAGSSNLTFDGTNLTVGGTASATKLIPTGGSATGNGMYLPAANTLAWSNNGSETMRLDSSGNLGLGVTPSAWSGFKVLESTNGNSVYFGTSQASLGSNAYNDGAGWKYKTTAAAGLYTNVQGTHTWYQAASGTAGTAISLTQAMTLDASGNFYVGTTSQSGGSNITFNQPANADMKIAASVSTGTRAAYQVFINTTVTTVGTENSTGGSLASGTAAYATVLANSGAYPVCFATNNTERMRLDSSGNLGLGVTPSTWYVGSGTSKAIQFNASSALYDFSASGNRQTQLLNNAYLNTSANFIYLNTDAASRYMQNAGAHTWYYAASGTAGNTISFTQAMTLDASGNLLVGTTNTSTTAGLGFKFAPTGDSANNPRLSIVTTASDTTTNLSLFSTSATNFRFYVSANGGIANYQANDSNLSDRNEKTNFAPAKSYLDTICAIPVQTFNYIDQSPDDPGTTLGVVAQDVQAVAPELVMESNWGTEDNPKMRLSIYQTDLQYALMKCIQEQQALIEQLTSRIAALESKGA